MRALLVLLLLAVACGRAATHADGSPAANAACTGGPFADACAAIENAAFRSIEQHEVGLGPDGPVLGSWAVSFASGSFVYDHSDVTESGTYTCSGLTVTGQAGGRTFAGVFDPACQVLTWDGVTYARLPGR